MLEEQARASQRPKRQTSISPPPAKRNRNGATDDFSRSSSALRGLKGPNSVPLSNSRQFGKRMDSDDQARRRLHLLCVPVDRTD